MTGEEYLKTVPREKLEDLVSLFCCPCDVNIMTEYRGNSDNCNDEYMGDCETCWKSKVITR